MPQRPTPAPTDCPGPDACAPVQASAHGWHLKREIQLGHLISTLAIAASAVAYINKMDQRLAIIETSVAEAKQHQASRDAQQDNAAAQSDALIRAQLVRIDEKLDRLIEKLSARGGR